MYLLIPIWAHVISPTCCAAPGENGLNSAGLGPPPASLLPASPHLSSCESPVPFPLQLFFTLTPEGAGAPCAFSPHWRLPQDTLFPARDLPQGRWAAPAPLPCELAFPEPWSVFASCSCCLSDISVSCDLLYLSSPLVHGYQVFRSESLWSPGHSFCHTLAATCPLAVVYLFTSLYMPLAQMHNESCCMYWQRCPLGSLLISILTSCWRPGHCHTILL